MNIRIQDIAERAGVSLTTVSLALNNKLGISTETRNRVLQIAKELNYSKHGRSAAMVAQKTVRFLQIVRHGRTVNSDHKVFLSDYINGIVQVAKQNNYKIEVTNFTTTHIDKIVASIMNQALLDGVIILGTELSSEDISALARVEIPVVFLDTFIDYKPFDFVDMNNEDSVFMLIEYLIAQGHRKIGMIRGAVETRNFRLREIAFKNTMSFFSLAVEPQYIFSVDSTIEGAYSDMQAILSKNPSLPTALFCTNDIIAFGVFKAFREAGIRIPDDISIIGFDDLPASELLDPPLTSIAVSKQEIGATAMQRIIVKISEGRSTPPMKIVVGGDLKIRGSVKRLMHMEEPT